MPGQREHLGSFFVPSPPFCGFTNSKADLARPMTNSTPPIANGPSRSRFGLCTFSCLQHWRAVEANHPGVRFLDAPGFFDYAHTLGAEGVQAALGSSEPGLARQIRERVERTGGYFEGELRLPTSATDVSRFETDVRLTREAGATVARTYFTLRRRYEAFATPDDFRRFHDEVRQSLRLAEPVLRRHRLRLAIENHKDLTTDELVALMREHGGEWIGVQVDTGNNLALLEDPYEAVEALAPWALSVHLKDMAVQPVAEGFLLSEVPLGTGLLDLPRLVARLRQANPAIVFNLEMATRDPLLIACLTDGYYLALPSDYRERRVDGALARVKAQPVRGPVPAVAGKSVTEILAEEEANNRACLEWMRRNLQTD
jgi:sugar phosphate isomerase/epimerase